MLVPLSALGVTLFAVAPRTRPTLRWPTLILLIAAMTAVPIASATGNTLLADLTASGALGRSALDKVLHHQALGQQVLAPVAALWVLTVGLASPRLFGSGTLVGA